MSTVKKAPRARKKPKRQITTPSDAEELLDWDAEITTYPPREVRTIRVKFVKVPRQLPSFTELDMD